MHESLKPNAFLSGREAPGEARARAADRRIFRHFEKKASAAAEAIPFSRTPSWPEALFDASYCYINAPWKIFIPHSTTTMAASNVAAVNTSKEATLIHLLRFPSPV